LWKIYFSPNECKKLIELCESIGFKEAGLAIGDDKYRVDNDIRDNTRVMIEDESLANALFQRIKDMFPLYYQGCKLISVNERFRIYKYLPGQKFTLHSDQTFVRPSPPFERTLFTLMIYLNEVEAGGGTTFFETPKKQQTDLSKLKMVHVVNPKTGNALAFDHYIYHEGSEVKSGVKYAIRSDIFYLPMRDNERIETAIEYFNTHITNTSNNFLELYLWIYSHLCAHNQTVKFPLAKKLWQVIFTNETLQLQLKSKYLSFLENCEGLEKEFPSISADTWLQMYNFLKTATESNILDVSDLDSWPLLVDKFASFIKK